MRSRSAASWSYLPARSIVCAAGEPAFHRGVRSGIFETGKAVPKRDPVVPRSFAFVFALIGRPRLVVLRSRPGSAPRFADGTSSTSSPARPAGAAPSQTSMPPHPGSSLRSSSSVTAREERGREQESAREAQRERSQKGGQSLSEFRDICSRSQPVPRSPAPRFPDSLVFSRVYAGRYAFWNRITHLTADSAGGRESAGSSASRSTRELRLHIAGTGNT